MNMPYKGRIGRKNIIPYLLDYLLSYTKWSGILMFSLLPAKTVRRRRKMMEGQLH